MKLSYKSLVQVLCQLVTPDVAIYLHQQNHSELVYVYLFQMKTSLMAKIEYPAISVSDVSCGNVRRLLLNFKLYIHS